MFNDNDNDHLLIRKLSYSSLRQLKFGQAITTTCIGAGTALHILFLTSLSFFKLRSVTVYCEPGGYSGGTFTFEQVPFAIGPGHIY